MLARLSAMFASVRMHLLIGGLCFAVGNLSGYIVRDTIEDAAKRSELELAITNLTAREEELRDYINNRAQTDLESARRLNDIYQNISNTTRSLSDEIDTVSEVADGLRLSRGAVSLLNDAITGLDGSAGVSDPSGAPAYSDPATSDTSFGYLLEWQLDAIDQYKRAAAQCNALIEWHETQLDNSR